MALGLFSDNVKDGCQHDGPQPERQNGGVVATINGSSGSPSGHAKNLANNDHIDLTNVLDPLNVLTPDDKPFTLMVGLSTDVASNADVVVKGASNSVQAPAIPGNTKLVDDYWRDIVTSKEINGQNFQQKRAKKRKTVDAW